MRRRIFETASTATLAGLVVILAACGAPGEAPETGGPAGGAGEAVSASAPQTATSVPEKVQKAAAIARAIQADPGSAEAILDKEGMTREEFEDLLYEIAADPALSAAYEAELTR